MRIGVIFLFFLSFANFGWGQTTRFVATDSISGSFSQFSVDNFGRIYLCENDVIRQYYKLNDTVYTASLKSFRPTSMESSKSFRTLVFDQDRSIVHFYDNTLTDIHGEINLVNYNIQQPLLVCESFAGNTFWVLDGGLMRLVKLNQDLSFVSQTENLVSLFDNDQEPSQMLEHNDYLYVLLPNKGVAIFDVFGTFMRIYPTNANAIAVFNNYLLLLTNNKIEAVANDAFLGPDFTYIVPEGIKSFIFSNQKVYFLLKDKLLIGNFAKA